MFVCRRPREKRERSFLSAVGALPDEKEKPWSTHATSGYGCIQQLSVHPNNIGGQQLRIVLSFSDCFLLLEVSVAGWRELSSRGNKSKLRNLLGHGESWLARSRERRCCENEVEKERKKRIESFFAWVPTPIWLFPLVATTLERENFLLLPNENFTCDATTQLVLSSRLNAWLDGFVCLISWCQRTTLASLSGRCLIALAYSLRLYAHRLTNNYGIAAEIVPYSGSIALGRVSCTTLALYNVRHEFYARRPSWVNASAATRHLTRSIVYSVWPGKWNGPFDFFPNVRHNICQFEPSAAKENTFSSSLTIYLELIKTETWSGDWRWK